MASPSNQGNLPWSNSQPLFGAPAEPWHSQSQTQSQSQFTLPAGGSQSFPGGSYSTAPSTAGTSFDATQHLNYGYSPPLLPGSFESMPSSFGGSQGFPGQTQLQQQGQSSQGGFNMSQSMSQGYAQPMAPPAPAPSSIAPWLAAAPSSSAPISAPAPPAPAPAPAASSSSAAAPPAKKPRKTNPNPKPRKKAGEGTPGAGAAPKERKKPGPKPRAKKSASARGENAVAGAPGERRSRSISQSVAPGTRGSVAPGARGGTAVVGEAAPGAPAGGAGEEDEEGDSEDEEEEDEALEDDELERQETIERERNERLGALMRAMTEEQYDRHESYRRGGLNKMTVKKLVNHVLSQSVSTPVALLFAGAGKVFIGEIVESARKIAAARPNYNPAAPLQPDDLREAFMAYKNERERPGLYAPGAPSAGAGAAGTGKRKRMF